MPKPVAHAGFYDSLAPFKEAFSAGQPALLYHKIDWLKLGVRRRGLYISSTIFRQQMHELRDAGFRSVLPGEVLATSGIGEPNTIIITFDDGFSNVLKHATPVLTECGFRAIQFIVPGLLGQTDLWDRLDGERPERLMDATEIRDWLAAGHEIGAHSMSHPHLIQLSPEAAREEIVTSKKTLEDRFQRPIRDFAYPFGEFNALTKQLVADAGFDRAWTTMPEINTENTDCFALLRYTAMVSLRKPKYLLRSIRWCYPLSR